MSTMPMTIAPILSGETSPPSQASPASLHLLPSLGASTELWVLSERWRKLAKDCEETTVAVVFGHSLSSSEK